MTLLLLFVSICCLAMSIARDVPPSINHYKTMAYNYCVPGVQEND